jgi:hypothetical protein
MIKVQANLGGEMLERLGHVLGWTCNIIACLFVALAIYIQLFIRMVSVPFPYIPNAFREPYLHETGPELFTFGIAVGVFLIGRALRYIFAGPSKHKMQ